MRCLWFALLLVSSLRAQPWDILGSRTIVTPFSYRGEGGAALAPNGDVLVAVSPCGAPGAVKLTSTYGTAAPCDTVVARVNPAGNLVFAIQLGGVDDGGPTLHLDSEGNIFVGGQTGSPSRFVTTPGAYLPIASQATTFPGFVCKLRPTDGTPLYCTFLDDSANIMTVDAAGDLLFTQLFLSTASGNSYTIRELDPTGAKLLMVSVPISGLGQAVANADGTFYVTGETPSAAYYGKVDPNAGLLFTQDFAATANFSLTLQPGVGPVLSGDFGSGFEVRQYASDGMTMVYDRSLPLFLNGRLSAINGGVLLVGSSMSAALPLVHNFHVCSQVLDPFSGEAVMIRLDPAGAVVQTTWLGSTSFGSLVLTTDSGWNALGSFGGSPNLSIQVVSVGPSPGTATEPLGCMADLAQGTRNTASPGLLVAVTIENDAAVGSVTAQPDASGRFPTTLAGMTLTFDGVAAPLFAFNGQQQLSAAVPFSVAGKTTTQMCLTYPSAAESCTAVEVVPFEPAVFGVLNEDGTINSASHPAPPGSILSFYLIGLGPLSPAVPDGTIVGTPLPQLATQVNVEFATGFPNEFGPFSAAPPPALAELTYAGPAPFEIAGVYQINARVPMGVGGMVTIVVGPLAAPVASANVNVVLGSAP